MSDIGAQVNLRANFSNGAFNIYTGGASNITAKFNGSNQLIMAGGATIASSTAGDIWLPYGSAVGATAAGGWGRIIPFDSATTGTSIKNAWINGFIGFYTSNGVTGQEIEKMRITPAGNVGIGTTAPHQALDVAGRLRSSDAASPFSWLVDMFVDRSGSNVSGTIQTGNTTTGLVLRTTNSSAPITFEPNSTERMRIATSGNVGIGTTSPAKTLDVSGTANISGTLYVASNTTISGSIKLAKTGGEPCGPATYYTIRIDPVTGGTQMCRP